MNDRQPVYHDKHRFRIISAPNGMWQAQTLAHDKGGTREIDPWRNLGHPTTREGAEARMNAAAQAKK